MRQVKLSWGRPALERTDLAPLLDIVEEITFLSYLRRTPKNVVIFAEAKFLNGQEPEELNNLYYIELLEVVQEPNKVDGHFLLKLKLDHPVSNMNSRTGGTSTIAGSKISQNGLIYKIRGSRMKISLLHTFIKAYAKPDSIQVSKLDYSNESSSPLNEKQLAIALHAYRAGYWDYPRRTRVGELAHELNLARATVSEHLTRISAILADEAFSTLEPNYTSPKVINEMISQVKIDAQASGYADHKEFTKMWDEIKMNIVLEEEDPILEESNLMISSNEEALSYYEENLSSQRQVQKSE